MAEKHQDVIMPGYTHLQRAQPVLFAHHMMAYFSMFGRDFDHLPLIYKHADVMPLGAGALAGTTYPIDQSYTQELLAFSKIYENSMDAVSDRDYVLEFFTFCRYDYDAFESSQRRDDYVVQHGIRFY